MPLAVLTQEELEGIEGRYAGIADILPLTPLQEGLLFHALYAAQGPDVYGVQLVLRLEGGLDAGVLEASAGALLDRHANLRAAFVHEGLRHPVQVICAAVSARWRHVDLSGLGDAEAAARLEGLLEADRGEHFDLAVAPLMRFTLIREGADRHRLAVAMHHILMDGWSLPILIRELLEIYAHHGDARSLPGVTPYRAYLGWLQAQDREAGQAAWRLALAGLEEGTLVAPAARERAPLAPERHTVTLSAELTGALTRYGRQEGLTLNTLVQGAWGVLLGRLTGRDDVVFGITVSGRPPEIAGIESMVGLLINTLPLRLRLAPWQAFGDLLADLQKSQAALLAHQHLGLSEIQGLAGVGELFDTLVVFENYPLDQGGLAAPAGGVRLVEIGGQDATHYPLSLMAVPGERMHLRLDYRADVFERGSVEALSERLVRVLEAVVARPGEPIGSIDILAARERDTILRGWNDTAHALPAATLPELFAAQAARTPDAVAVVFEDERLSYGELDARSNQLAHHLRGLGVGPEVIVGLCVERSPAMVIGLIGILKAGGAYLPLDPEYPAERLAFMLADADAAVLVTQTPLRSRLGSEAVRCVLLDADAATIARHPASAPAGAALPANTAYVIYTSGSTGVPKGVAVTHSRLRNRDAADVPTDSRSRRPRGVLSLTSLELRRRDVGDLRRP